MGMLDAIKKFFRGSNNTPKIQEDDPYEKSILIPQIINTIDKIKRINSFDSSIWNLSNVSSYDLQRKSLSELKSLKDSLDARLEEITRQRQQRASEREDLEKSKWTGQKLENVTDYEFDRFQRDEGR